MKVELLAITPSSEELIENAARVCYKSKSNVETRSGFLKGIIKRGHLSVVEHATATFRISDVSRALTHQLVRHRMASYSQESQRYVKVKQPEFVTPPSINSNKDIHKKYTQAVLGLYDLYQEMIQNGIPAEDARFILPNSATTTIVMSANFREWLHFINLRSSPYAQWEIRDLAIKIKEILSSQAPSIFGDVNA